MVYKATRRLFDQNPIIGMSWLMAGTSLVVLAVSTPIR